MKIIALSILLNFCFCQCLQVCAHRFRLSDPRGAFRWGLGQCVTLTNNLDENLFLQPCAGRDMNTRGGGFAYGFCQAGTSAVVSKVQLFFNY